MDVLDERLRQVEWWVPGLREVDGGLFLLWLVLVPALLLWGGIALLHLWRARRVGKIGPQEYRWRSSERGAFFGKLAANGLVVVPAFCVIATFAGLFLITAVISDEAALNLMVIAGIIYWFFAYRWLYRHLRAGLRESERPDFGDDAPDLPFFLRRATD